jgi:molecular chaperone HtpG
MAKYEYKSEVGDLLKLMSESLYSHKEIFIRELISNASDALDKLEYLKLTDKKLKTINSKPEINITFDEKLKTLTISDNGVGMNEEDLKSSLGTIARSGTKNFIQNLSKDDAKNSQLIGQFGVGFYSVFMVAKKVDVITKKAGEDLAYKFSSDGSGAYEISKVIKGSQGSVVYIELKDEDASEYGSKWGIENVVKKYSNHIAYPITLHYTEEEAQEQSEEDKKAKKDVIKKIVKKKEQLNDAKALWMQAKAKLKPKDYNEFYTQLSGDNDEPLSYIHTKAEGVHEYTTLFYIPKKAPFDLFRVDYKAGVKLYVKRVFITDDEKELLPTYLRFVKGIIDSEDLPLNVSRELLQDNKVMANIKQASIKKILNEIKKISKDENKYKDFIEQYNRLLKEGVYQDYTNKDLLCELVRYKSTNKADTWTSLEDYKARAKTEQKAIYYIVGDNEKVLNNSPLIESYKQNNIEVLILDDKEIDEVVAPSIGTYKEWELKDISSANPPELKVDEKKTKKT